MEEVRQTVCSRLHGPGTSPETCIAQASASISQPNSSNTLNVKNGQGLGALDTSSFRSPSPIAITSQTSRNGSSSQGVLNRAASIQPSALPSPHSSSDSNSLELSTRGKTSSGNVLSNATTTSDSRDGNLGQPKVPSYPNPAIAAQSATARPDSMGRTIYDADPTMVASGIQLSSNGISSSQAPALAPTTSNVAGNSTQPLPLLNRALGRQVPLSPPSIGPGISIVGSQASRGRASIAMTASDSSRNLTLGGSHLHCISKVAGASQIPSVNAPVNADAMRLTTSQTDTSTVLNRIQFDSHGASSARNGSPNAITFSSGIATAPASASTVGSQKSHSPSSPNGLNSLERSLLSTSTSRSGSRDANVSSSFRNDGIASTAQVSTPNAGTQRPIGPQVHSPTVSSGIQLSSSGISSSRSVSPIVTTARTFSPILPTTTRTASVRGDSIDTHTQPAQDFSALAGAVVPTREQTENNLRRRSSGATFSALAGAVVPTPEQTENNIRRRSSGARSRPSSSTSFGGRASGFLIDTAIAQPSIGSPNGVTERSASQSQNGISIAGIQISGLRVSSMSPHQSSAASFASPSPPLGATVTPTMSVAGRGPSPLTSIASPAPWLGQAATSSPLPALQTARVASRHTGAPLRQRSSSRGVVAHSTQQSYAPAREPMDGMTPIQSSGNGNSHDNGGPLHPSRTDVLASMSRSVQVSGQNPLASSSTAASLALLQQAQVSSLRALAATSLDSRVLPVDSPPTTQKMHVDAGGLTSLVARKDVLSPAVPLELENDAAAAISTMARVSVSSPETTRTPPSGSNTAASRDLSERVVGVAATARTPSADQAAFEHGKELGLEIAEKAHRDYVISSSSGRPSETPEAITPVVEAPDSPSDRLDTDAVASLLEFDFKPPAKPIPSLPDWLSATHKGKKRSEDRPSLPDWASGRLEEAGFAIMPASNGNKRRRTKSPERLWSERGVGSAELPIDLDEAESDTQLSPTTLDEQDSMSAQNMGQTVDIQVDDLERDVITPPEDIARRRKEPENLSTHQGPVEDGESSKPSGDVVSTRGLQSSSPVSFEDGRNAEDPQREEGQRTSNASVDASPSVAEPSSPIASAQHDDVEMHEATTIPNARGSESTSVHSTSRHPDEGQSACLQGLERPARNGPATPNLGSSTLDDTSSVRRSFAHTGPRRAALKASAPPELHPAVSEGSGNQIRERVVVHTGPIAHHISAEVTSEDLVRWQRRAWRACFCDWAGCGAVLNDWESLEKVGRRYVFLVQLY